MVINGHEVLLNRDVRFLDEWRSMFIEDQFYETSFMQSDFCKSIGLNSTALSIVIGSVAYTHEDVTEDVTLVSKYMNNTVDTRPVHIYFAKEEPNLLKDNTFNESRHDLPRQIFSCTTWNELVEFMKLEPVSMCINSFHFEKSSLIEVINMVSTFAKLVNIEKPINITLGVTKDTPYQLVKEAQKLSITGIVPSSNDFPLDECQKAIVAQWNNIPYWPKDILEQLPGAKKTHRTKPDEIKLTPRQEQILFLIKERGSSNKVIAKTLNITESTVKLHVGLVLKKFGVKNRTQLAVFSKK